MGQTATVSTAIIDSTLVGRELITAADEAAARLSLELSATDDVTFSSVSAVDGDFSGTVTTDLIDTVGQYLVFYNAGVIAANIGSSGRITSWLDIVPSADGTKSSGLGIRRWSNVYSVDGSFTGNLNSEVGGTVRHYSTGTEGDPDTSFIEMGDDGTRHTIYTTQSGAGTYRNLRVGNSAHYMEVVPTSAKMDWYISGVKRFSVTSSGSSFYTNLIPSSSVLECGTDAQRWGTVYSVDGNFSGDITVDDTSRITSSDKVRIGGDSGSVFYIGTNARIIHDSAGLYPNPTLACAIGTSARRFSAAYFAAGSFTGNLNTEVGGSQRVYNLGTDGDTDTEYLETSWDANVATIANRNTGINSQRDLVIQAGMEGGDLELKGSRVRLYDGASLMLNVDSSSVQLYGTLQPSHTNTRYLGTDALRWRNTYSVDGSFSGTLNSEVGGSARVYHIGTDGDANTEFLELKSNGVNHTIYTAATGTGNDGRELSIGNPNGRIRLGSNYMIYAVGGTRLNITSSYVYLAPAISVIPTTDGTVELGMEGSRWENVASVDGSFSGNLNVESGGSQRIYNLGTEGDTDTEFLDLSCTTNQYRITSDGTGAGSKSRNIYLGTALDQTGTTRGMLVSNSSTIFSHGGTLLTIKGGDGILVNTHLIPNISSFDCGSATKRWGTVYGVDGSYSGNLNVESGGSQRVYNLGAEGDTDTEYLETRTVSDIFVINPTSTGAGANRDFFLQSALKGSYGNIRLASTGLLYLRYSNTANITVGNGYNIIAATTRPAITGTTELGNSTYRWSNVASVNGSFSGNLNSEVGGTQRVYNLGTEGDTDSEYLETSWTANSALIASKATGTGVLREIAIGSDSCKFESRPATNQATIRTDSLPRMVFLGGITRVWNTTQFSPQTNAATLLGNASSRWSNVYSVAGNFSGNVIMAANVDFTGLPTADPVVAGRLWNDGGTMKISAG